MLRGHPYLKFQIGSIIIVAGKSLLPAVALLRHMMGEPRSHNSSYSRHVRILALLSFVVNKKVWCPRNSDPELGKELRKNGAPDKVVFQEIAERYEFEIDTMEVKDDHVHLFLGGPPRYSAARVRS